MPERACSRCAAPHPGPGPRCQACTNPREVNGWKWTALRARVIRRDGGCVTCGSTDQLQVHHVIPLSEGGTDDPGNLQTLCYSHHLEAHHQ